MALLEKKLEGKVKEIRQDMEDEKSGKKKPPKEKIVDDPNARSGRKAKKCMCAIMLIVFIGVIVAAVIYMN